MFCAPCARRLAEVRDQLEDERRSPRIYRIRGAREMFDEDELEAYAAS